MIRTEHEGKEWIFPFVKYSADKSNKKLPLIIQLHGAGEWGGGGEELHLVETHGFSRIMSDIDSECIIVMPQCPPDSFWAAKVESLLLFIEQLKKRFDIDEERISLTGFSMGGYGTWFTAMAKPQLFSAIAPVCGGGMAWKAIALDMPVWAFHGTEDDVVTPVQTEEMVERLKLLGRDVTYTKFEGEGHSIQELAYTTKLLHWLLSKKRKNS